MDSHGSEHGAHDEGHGVHLPDPSYWPLVVGLASLVAGIALIWWSNDRGNNLAGPLLGVALTFVLVSAGGWAYEDGRMRKKAELGAAPQGKSRFTQVLTFAVAEGQLDSARGSEGVISTLERTDLRDINGFQDLRVTVSPASTGPSQVIVETTWTGRQGLEGYDATRLTLLDTINGFDQQVVPGTVQAFDMEVVRDTKDTSFKFGTGAAATVLGGLLIGGFALGATLSLFQSDAAAGGGGEAPVVEDPYTVRATDNKFNKAVLQALPESDVTFTLENRGRAKHNLAFYQSKGGAEIKKGDIIDGGETNQVSFKSPAAGSYFFQCDVHPDQMTGTFDVTPSAPPPAPAAPAATATAAP
jgi:plastocyanin